MFSFLSRSGVGEGEEESDAGGGSLFIGKVRGGVYRRGGGWGWDRVCERGVGAIGECQMPHNAPVRERCCFSESTFFSGAPAIEKWFEKFTKNIKVASAEVAFDTVRGKNKKHSWGPKFHQEEQWQMRGEQVLCKLRRLLVRWSVLLCEEAALLRRRAALRRAKEERCRSSKYSAGSWRSELSLKFAPERR